VKRVVAILVAVTAVGVGILFGCKPAEAATKHRIQIIMKVYNDCENVMTVPCVTLDDGAWRKVTSYKPYRSVKISKPMRFGDRWLVITKK
jgi:hypothetical protein